MTEETVDNPSILDWLDDAYIQNIVTTYEKQEVKIIKYEKELATSKGENFVSALHRIRIQYNTKTNSELKRLSVIVKSQAESDLLEEIESNFNIFERESQVYNIIMRSCEDLLRTIGDSTYFGPRAIYVDERIIVLEDLKEKGFALMDSRKGLNYEHCKRVLEKLAKFHATTKILYEKNPELFKYHIAGNLTEVPTPLHDLYKNTINTCIEYSASNDELLQFVPHLKSYEKDIVQKEINVFTRNPDGFNILNHGDMWINNLMFKKDADGNIEDVLLIDYQEGYLGSPGIDLNYFIYTSWTKEVYQNCREDLINVYFNVLKDTLMKLNAKQIPTLDGIKQEIHEKADHGLIAACCILPIVISEHAELADPMTFLSDDKEARENRFIVFNNPNYGKILKLVLPDFIKQVQSTRL